MSAGQRTGRDSIAAAKALARICGVEIMGWNDRVGREFLSVNGDGDKLKAFQREIEKEGWYLWPVAEEMEGFSLDFAMRPPPDVANRKQAATSLSESPIPYAGTDFRYSGLSVNFASTLVAAVACGTIVALVVVGILFPGPLSHQAVVLTIVAAAAVAIAVAAPDWSVVTANRSVLTIRKPLLGRSHEIPVAEIERAKAYLNRSSGLTVFKTGYLVVQLKSGKAYNLYLPKRARGELATFLTSLHDSKHSNRSAAASAST
jgi:hypothetical protein